MKFSKQVIVTRTFEMTSREFVEKHLREIRAYKKHDGTHEYDLLVQCGVNSGFITTALTLKNITFGINDFDVYASTDAEKKAHKEACEKLVVLIDAHFADEKSTNCN